jgi:hypothetical protein
MIVSDENEGTAAAGTVGTVPIGETVEGAPAAWIVTDKTPDDPENPNRALLMGANSSNPQLVANALNTYPSPAADYALTNLLEPDSEGLATAHNGGAKLYESTYAPAFATPTFYALLNPSARGALVGAIQRINLGGAAETTAFLAQLGASLDASSVKMDTAAPVAEVVGIKSADIAVPSDLPFDVESSHALDSLPAGAMVTKDSDTSITVDHPTNGTNGQSLPVDDVLEHVPTGTVVSVLGGKTAAGPTTFVAVTLPANAHRGRFTVISISLHKAIASAWAWVVDEAKAVEAELKKR